MKNAPTLGKVAQANAGINLAIGVILAILAMNIGIEGEKSTNASLEKTLKS